MSRLHCLWMLALVGCGDRAVDALVSRLSVAVDYPEQVGPVDLTALGTLDWVHHGLDTPTTVTRKARAEVSIGQVAVAGGMPDDLPRRYGNDPLTFKWTDGTPTREVTGTQAGIYIEGLGRGFEVVLPIGPDERVFTAHLGGWMARAKLEILRGSDRGVLYTNDRMLQTGLGTPGTDPGGQFARPIRITCQSAVETGETSLILRYTLSTGGNVTLTALAARRSGR